MNRKAKSSQMLAITGAEIDDVKLVKKARIEPGQSCSVLELAPLDYSFEAQALSAEKLPVLLPAILTIGPRFGDHEGLLNYAKLISSHDKLTNHHVKEIVQKIFERETRVLAASMTMEEILRGPEEFKQEVFEKVQLELNQFGLLIYNNPSLNVIHAEAMTKAKAKVKIDAKMKVIEAEAKAKIDAKRKVSAIRRAKLDETRRILLMADFKVFENEIEDTVAEANCELAKKKSVWKKETRVAEVEATKAVDLREAELQAEVDRVNALTTIEKHRVKCEIKMQEIDCELYKKLAEAKAQIALADAALYDRKKAAEAELYAKNKDAEGIVIVGNAIATLGNNYLAVREYLFMNGENEIAKIKAEAKVKAEVYVKIVKLVFGLIAVILVILALKRPASEAWLVVKQ